MCRDVRERRNVPIIAAEAHAANRVHRESRQDLTPDDIRQLADQIRSARMRKMSYDFGSLLVDAMDGQIHRLAGYARFEDWYMDEFNELSCPRTLWDIVKIERVRRSLDIPAEVFQSVDVSKAKAISQLCGRDGIPKYPLKRSTVAALFDRARTETLVEISNCVKSLK